jgi:hypothetical protein
MTSNRKLLYSSLLLSTEFCWLEFCVFSMLLLVKIVVGLLFMKLQWGRVRSVFKPYSLYLITLDNGLMTSNRKLLYSSLLMPCLGSMEVN